MIWYVTLRIYYCLCFNNNNSLHLYSAFLGGQSALHRRGRGDISSSPPVCSIHLDDDVTAAILRHNDHHTPAYWWREDRVMKSMGWLGGHDGQRPTGKFVQDTRVTHPLFFEGHPGIFNDHRPPRFIVSSEGSCLCPRHYTGALEPTQTTGGAPAAGLTLFCLKMHTSSFFFFFFL